LAGGAADNQQLGDSSWCKNFRFVKTSGSFQQQRGIAAAEGK
jgi:hypothetical protein